MISTASHRAQILGGLYRAVENVRLTCSLVIVAEAARREVTGPMVSGCPALCGCDDGGEVLDVERIGTCPAHVLEGSTKVVHRSSMILPQRR